MTAAIRAIIKFAMVRMRVRRIIATPFIGNIASMKVFLKNDFEHRETAENAVQLPQNRGGGKAGVYILMWEYEKSVLAE